MKKCFFSSCEEAATHGLIDNKEEFMPLCAKHYDLVLAIVREKVEEGKSSRGFKRRNPGVL